MYEREFRHCGERRSLPSLGGDEKASISMSRIPVVSDSLTDGLIILLQPVFILEGWKTGEE